MAITYRHESKKITLPAADQHRAFSIANPIPELINSLRQDHGNHLVLVRAPYSENLVAILSRKNGLYCKSCESILGQFTRLRCSSRGRVAYALIGQFIIRVDGPCNEKVIQQLESRLSVRLLEYLPCGEESTYVLVSCEDVEAPKTLVKGRLLSENKELSSFQPNILQVHTSSATENFFDEETAACTLSQELLALRSSQNESPTISLIDCGVDTIYTHLRDSIATTVDVTDSGTEQPAYDSWHGTACAGIIAGLLSSNRSSKNISWRQPLISIKAASTQNSSCPWWLFKGICQSIQRNSRVLSLSWECTPTECISEALRLAVRQGASVVAAVGYRVDVCAKLPFPSYMAAEKGSPMIAVSAWNDDTAWIIMECNEGKGVTIAASGYQLCTTTLGQSGKSHGFEARSGTSFATALVAGTVGLMLRENSSLQPAEIKNILIRTAESFKDAAKQSKSPENPDCLEGRFGCGVLNIDEAINAAKASLSL